MIIARPFFDWAFIDSRFLNYDHATTDPSQFAFQAKTTQAFTPNTPVNGEGQLEYKFVFFFKYIGLSFEDNVIITQGLLDRDFIDTVIDTESRRDLYIKDHPDG